MKNYILSIFVLVSIVSFSQETSKTPFSFGVKAGVYLPEVSNFIGGNYDKTTSITPTLGGFANYELNDKMSLQGDLMYSRYVFSVEGDEKFTFSGESINGVFDSKFKLDYITIPLVFKYEIFNKFSLEAGPQFSFLLSAKGEAVAKHASGVEIGFQEKDLDVLIKEINSFGINKVKGDVREFEVGLVGGLNYDLPYNLSLNARYYLSFIDLFPETNFSGKDKIKAKNIALNFMVAYTF